MAVKCKEASFSSYGDIIDLFTYCTKICLALTIDLIYKERKTMGRNNVLVYRISLASFKIKERNKLLIARLIVILNIAFTPEVLEKQC